MELLEQGGRPGRALERQRLVGGGQPNVGASDNLLNGVSATTTGDVWAVGSSEVFARTLALRGTG